MDKATVLYLLIDPAERRVTPARFTNLDEACAAVHLIRNEVDHGSLGDGHGIVVHEHGLMKQPPEQQHLFAIGPHLYEGNAVIYAEAHNGKRVDATPPPIRWFKSVEEVWQAIEQGEVVQPYSAIGGEVWWVWPDPKRA